MWTVILPYRVIVKTKSDTIGKGQAETSHNVWYFSPGTQSITLLRTYSN